MLFGSEIASLYVQPHIGGDLALLAGIAKRIEETGAINENFLLNHCDGWEPLKQNLQSLSWDEITSKSGVTQQEINHIAEKYATAKNVIFSWTMGITHHLHGVQNVQAIGNLAMMRGMVGRPHAGLMPIRGHSNVQGIGSMGVTPQLKEAIFERLQTHYNVELPTTTGMDTMQCMEAADVGKATFGFCLGGNLYGSNPDLTFAEQSLSILSTLCYMNTTLNNGHAFALADETIILPVLARDEEPQPTTQESMFNFVRLSDGGKPRHTGPRSEVEVIAEIASSVLGDGSPVDWNDMQNTGKIRSAISNIIPGWEKIETIDQTKEEFQIAGRTFHQPTFATPNNRAQLHTHDLPDLPGDDNQLRLMTIRSEGQFNTVVYEEYDLYRGQDRRDIILMHPDDLSRLNVQNDQRVTVYSKTGKMQNILVKAYNEIRAGNAMMYFPEANILVSRDVDPQSKTPAYKCVLVWLETES